MAIRFYEERVSLIIVITSIALEGLVLSLGFMYFSAQVALLLAFIPIMIVLCFFSLRVVIDDDLLVTTYGVGLITRSVPFELIQSYEVVPNMSLSWVYSPTQEYVLKIFLRNGDSFRIGVGDPGRLMELISSSLRG